MCQRVEILRSTALLVVFDSTLSNLNNYFHHTFQLLTSTMVLKKVVRRLR
jgi:hypothetical protein